MLKGFWVSGISLNLRVKQELIYMNVIYRIWTWWLFFLQTVSGAFILKLSSDHSGLRHLPFLPSRILLVTWPSWYLCFHFSFIRSRVKNFFLCTSFLNNNNLTRFLETGNRLWGDQWWRKSAWDIQATELCASVGSRLALKARDEGGLIVTCPGQASGPCVHHAGLSI